MHNNDITLPISSFEDIYNSSKYHIGNINGYNYDFKKFMLLPNSLLDYKSRKKLKSAKLDSLIDFFMNRINHGMVYAAKSIGQIVFSPIMNFLESSFCRSIELFDKLILYCRKFNYFRSMIRNKVRKLSVNDCKFAIDYIEQNYKWDWLYNKKQCFMSVASGNGNFPQCTKKPSNDFVTCFNHRFQFDPETDKNLFLLSKRFPPDLSKLKSHLGLLNDLITDLTDIPNLTHEQIN